MKILSRPDGFVKVLFSRKMESEKGWAGLAIFPERF